MIIHLFSYFINQFIVFQKLEEITVMFQFHRYFTLIIFCQKFDELHFFLILQADDLPHEQYLCKHLLSCSFQYQKMHNKVFSFQVFLEFLLISMFLKKELDKLIFFGSNLDFLIF